MSERPRGWLGDWVPDPDTRRRDEALDRVAVGPAPMQPGRDLDALVAERVMGLRDAVQASGWPVRSTNPVPAYSTDIAAAWQVVERMQKQGRDVRLKVYGFDDDSSVRVAIESQVDGYGSSEVVHAWEATAPHAICLAALRALGVEVP